LEARRNMERIHVVLKGIRPLLMNRMSQEQLEGLRDKTKKKATTAEKMTPQQEAETKVYAVDGKPVIPTENLMACLIAAGQFIRLDGKRQLSTGKSTILPGILAVEDPVLWLYKASEMKVDVRMGTPDTFGLSEWKYDMRQGVNPNGAQAVCIVRPRFDDWGLNFHIQVDPDALKLDAFRQLFDYAGMRVGLCDFRPACKGSFGMFRVDHWVRIPVSVAAS
jgi:hypothetical protein